MPNKERKGKWQPFDALEGFKEALENTKYRRFKNSKPDILPDIADEIDRILKESVLLHKKIEVKYFYDGYVLNLSGIITVIDNINNFFVMNGKKYKIDSIVDIEQKN